MRVTRTMQNEKRYRQTDVYNALLASEIARAETVLVHCSLKSFGALQGGAVSVVEALLALENTVLFPAFTGKITDGINCPPKLNLRQSPTWTGLIPETARRRTDALRSLHPTHSLVGFGARAQELLAGHDQTLSPCDASSPFYKLAQCNGIIALFGCDHNSNTMVHCCEEIAKVAYHLQTDITYGSVVTETREIIVANRLHNWQKPPTDFNKIELLLIGAGAVKLMNICDSRVKIIDARKMFAVVYNQLLIQPDFLLA